MPVSKEVVPFFLSHQRCERILFFFFTSSSTFDVVSLLHFSHLNGYVVGSRVVFVCISIMTNDSEHCFTCLLVIHVSSLVKCLFKYFVC